MGNVTSVKSKTFAANGASTAAICANQTNSGSGSMTLTDTGKNGVLVPGNLGTTITIISTTGTTNAGITFDVTGMDINGESASQTAITGPAGSATVTTTQVFVSVTSITHSGTCTDVSCGITATTTGTGVVTPGRTRIRGMHVVPSGTEGYRTAEVTLGGVDTDELSSKTMQTKNQPGLYFIGEVVDVTGHLGGFNFQWAWSSGYACAQSLAE